MSAVDPEPEPDAEERLVRAVRERRDRHRRWLKEGEPTVFEFIGQIGVVGWMIVTPGLVGLFVGRWLDHRFGTGVFWSAPLLMVGVALGFWSAWRWMHRQ